LILGDIYFARKDYSGALAEYQEASSINPKLAEAHFKAGEALFKLERYHEAILKYRVALFINSKLTEAHHRLGRIYFTLRQYETAISQYRAALALNPQWAVALADLGDLYATQGRYREAIGKYRSALELADLTCKAGNHLAAHGHYLEAIAEYRSALNMDSELILPEAVTEEVIYALGLRRDRRKHGRFFRRFSVKHRESADLWHQAATVNVSKEGLLVESSRKIEVGSKVKVVGILNQDGQSIVVRGRVVWMDREETGSDYRFGIELFSEEYGNQVWENFLVA
jgi:tetratricopeptide (TPR) repeat protein